MAKCITNLADLMPDAGNANKGTERGRYMVEASLRETGAGRSIVVDKDGNVIAGNKTLEAWAEMGGEIEVIRSDGRRLVVVQREDLDLSDTEGPARKLAYYDNRAGQVGLEWDTEQLLADIGAGLDLSVMFHDDELNELLAELREQDTEPVDADPQIDRAEELREKWGVQSGDLWQLGQHRLICGDCTDADVVARLMGGERAQILFTSPPYWVGFDYEQENKWGEVLGLVERFCRLYVAFVVGDGRIIINTGTVQAGQLTGQKAHMRLLIDTWAQEFERNGWLMRYVRFWVKDGGLLHTAPQSDCIDQHTEFIGYFYNPQAKFRGGERTGEPWAGKGYWDDIPGAARQSGHIAAFPVELASRNIQLFTRNGELVLDPFAGSGTTIVACESLNRQCRAAEISPAYCAVILERWATATGGTPQRVE